MLTATAQAKPTSGRVECLVAASNRPVAADSAAMFRILFGLLIAYSSVRFLAKGWVQTLYLAPENHLTFAGFGWVEPLLPMGMYGVIVGQALLGLAIAVGYRHRLAAALFTVSFAYVELIDAALYLNHYWYVTLVSAFLVVLPVHHRWSLDSLSGRVQPSATVPVGVVWVLRAQLGVVYLFAGLGKLNADWLVHAQPMRLWLADRTHLAIVGPLLDEPGIAYLASWSGALFDCTIVGWLLWRRSRPVAYVAVVGFHLFTGWLFQIGVFPLVMIAGTLVFFAPEWPQRFRRVVPARWRLKPVSTVSAFPKLSHAAVAGFVLLAAVQVVLPLRHLAYDSNVRWSEEGYYLSWRVMLTEKSGFVEYRVTDPLTGQTWNVGPELVLTDWQMHAAAVRPDLIHNTAQLINQFYEADVEVRADAFVAMNGHPARRLIDPSVDLAHLPRTLGSNEWIEPEG